MTGKKTEITTFNDLKKFAPAELWAFDTLAATIIALKNWGRLDEIDYFDRYPDVAKTNMDAITHYIKFGHREGRTINIKESEESQPDKLQIYRQGGIDALYIMPLEINWLITSCCNYRCSYCPGAQDTNRNLMPSFENLKSTIDKIASLNRDYYTFTLSGGEPTVHPHIYELIEYMHITFKDKLNSITIITNGSRQSNLYEKLSLLSNNVNLNFIISLHTEFLNIDHITEIIKILSNKSTLLLSLLYNPTQRETAKKIYCKLLELIEFYKFNLGIVMVRVGKNMEQFDPRFTNEDYKWCEQARKKFIQKQKKFGNFSPLKTNIKRSLFWDYNLGNQQKFITSNGIDKDKFQADGLLGFKNMWCMTGSSMLSIYADGTANGAQCAVSSVKYNIFTDNPFEHKDFLLLYYAQPKIAVALPIIIFPNF